VARVGVDSPKRFAAARLVQGGPPDDNRPACGRRRFSPGARIRKMAHPYGADHFPWRQSQLRGAQERQALLLGLQQLWPDRGRHYRNPKQPVRPTRI
jgi:hypothetical protein